MRNDRKGSDVFFEKDTSDIYRKIEKIWNWEVSESAEKNKLYTII